MTVFNFSERIRHVFASAADEARGRQHEYVGIEHLLLGLLNERDGVATAVVAAAQIDVTALRQELEARVPRGTVASTDRQSLPYTTRAKKVLEHAMAEARDLDHTYLGTEHVLLGILREDMGIGAQLLTHAGLSLAFAREETVRILGSTVAPMPSSTARRPIACIHVHVTFADGGVEQYEFDAVALRARIFVEAGVGQRSTRRSTLR